MRICLKKDAPAAEELDRAVADKGLDKVGLSGKDKTLDDWLAEEEGDQEDEEGSTEEETESEEYEEEDEEEDEEETDEEEESSEREAEGDRLIMS